MHIIPVSLYNTNPHFDPDEDQIVDNNGDNDVDYDGEAFTGGIEIVRDEDGYLEDVICHAPTEEVHFVRFENS